MKPSGKTILNFFKENFDFLVELFQNSKKDNFFISSEVLINRCNSYNVNLKTLEEYKILIPLLDGKYEFNKRFTDFISFLIDDFRLDLPESILKYKISIQNLFSQITLDTFTLNKQKTINELIQSTDGLINELREFNLLIQSNTEQLFVETSKIRQNKEKLPYSTRIQKATYLIENYIKPMNDILNREHSDSFIRQIIRIHDFANLQRYESSNLALQKQFETLYYFLSNLKNEILKNSSIMAKDISPLLERLKNESEIMQGVEIFLLNAKRGKIEQKVPFFELKNKQKRVVYSTDFELTAKHFLLERIQKIENPINLLSESQTNEEVWIFDRKTYKEKLFKALPLENFFAWCYNTLQEEAKNLNSNNFYYLVSLLLEKEIKAEFSMEKFPLELSDYILLVPIVKVSV